MNYPRCKQKGYQKENILLYHARQGAENITHEILRLRSGSVRIIDFDSLSFLKSISH